MNNDPFPSPSDSRPSAITGAMTPNNLFGGIIGAAIGGAVGYAVFVLVLGLGFYALVVPGALLGLGCSIGSRTYSRTLAIICAVAAVPLSLFAEWSQFPFIADESFTYFITHLHNLRLMTWIMFVFGVLSAYWIGIGKPSGTRSS